MTNQDREDFEGSEYVANLFTNFYFDHELQKYNLPEVQLLWQGFQAARALDAERIKYLTDTITENTRGYLEKLAAAELAIKQRDTELKLILESLQTQL